MAAAVTTTIGRCVGLMVVGVMVLILLSFVRSGDASHPQAVRHSRPVPAATGARAPVVEPDPRRDNVVPGVTSQVTMEAPVPMAHHGHQHHK